MTLTITLPLPHKSLSPNYTVGSKGQRMGKAAQTKKHRHWAMLAGSAAWREVCEWAPEWKEATAQLTFYWRTRRRRDKDNADGSVKSYMDGLADAGVIDDDVGLTRLPTKFEYDKAQPRVVIEIWETDSTKGT